MQKNGAAAVQGSPDETGSFVDTTMAAEVLQTDVVADAPEDSASLVAAAVVPPTAAAVPDAGLFAPKKSRAAKPKVGLFRPQAPAPQKGMGSLSGLFA
jgi:hypothetical protein